MTQPAAEQPRIPLDELTSDALDQLYADLDRCDEVQGEMNEQAIDHARRIAQLEDLLRIANDTSNTSETERVRAAERAERAEAAIESVRALAERIRTAPHHWGNDACAAHIRAALDEHQEQTLPTPKEN